jgi:glycosyltransferase involved in cell wall biosynthesis
MRRAILLDEFTRLGGGQVLGIHIVRALSDSYKFDLMTDRYHEKLDSSIFGKVTETRYMYHEGINPVKVAFGVLKLRQDLKRHRKDMKKYDLSINNHPNIFLYSACVNVLHEPLLRESMKNGKFQKSILSEVIKTLGIYSIYDKANIVVNGKYMLEINKTENRYLSISPRVHIITPPVSYPETVEFSAKKKIVLTFGRINPDKGLETVIEVARKVNCKFVIAGAVNEGSENYYYKLMNEKPRNVVIVKNPSELEKGKLMSSAKIYLHTKPYESFGLSVAEAIGHGCIPIVPKSGGQWIDIIANGKYGYGYDAIDEATEIIKEAMNYDSVSIQKIYDSRQRFSFQRFKDDWERYVSEIS